MPRYSLIDSRKHVRGLAIAVVLLALAVAWFALSSSHHHGGGGGAGDGGGSGGSLSSDVLCTDIVLRPAPATETMNYGTSATTKPSVSIDLSRAAPTDVTEVSIEPCDASVPPVTNVARGHRSFVAPGDWAGRLARDAACDAGMLSISAVAYGTCERNAHADPACEDRDPGHHGTHARRRLGGASVIVLRGNNRLTLRASLPPELDAPGAMVGVTRFRPSSDRCGSTSRLMPPAYIQSSTRPTV
jgi:hypothetical protein